LLRARRELRPALAERQGLVPAALHLADHEDPERDHQQDRRPRNEHRRPRAGRALLGIDDDALLHQAVDEALVRRRHVRRELLVLAFGGQGDVLAPNLVAEELDPFDLLLVDAGEELREGDSRTAGLQRAGKLPDQREDDDQGHPEEETLEGSTHFVPFLTSKVTMPPPSTSRWQPLCNDACRRPEVSPLLPVHTRARIRINSRTIS